MDYRDIEQLVNELVEKKVKNMVDERTKEIVEQEFKKSNKAQMIGLVIAGIIILIIFILNHQLEAIISTLN